MNKPPSISIVIPAYNEDEYIKGLIKQIVPADNIKEIVIIDDGSEKKYADIYDTIEGVRVIHREKNGGKDEALKDGIRNTTGDYILFLDADLQGVTTEHINELQKFIPEYEIIRVLRGADSKLAKLFGTTYVIGGEHLMDRRIVEKFYDNLFKKVKWGFESEINNVIVGNPSINTLFCEFRGVEHIMKYKKHGVIKGWSDEMKMVGNVVFAKNKFFGYAIKRVQLQKYLDKRVFVPN